MTIMIQQYLDDQAPLTGTFGSNTTTDDTTPLLQGALTSFGAGDVVFIFRNGSAVGFANVVPGLAGTATWTYQDSGLADGNTYTYTAMILNLTTFANETSAEFKITVSTTPVVTIPTPTIVSVLDNQGPSTGTISNGGTTDDTTPTLKGTLSAALTSTQAVHVFRGTDDLGTATVTGGTNWEFTDPTGLANGSYGYTAKVVDGTTTGTASGIFNITVAPDSTGSVTTTTSLKVWDDAAPVTGWVVDGDTMNDDTPTIQGTLSAPLAAGETVHVFRSVNGGASIDWGQATVTGTDWTFGDSGLITNNQYTYTARVVSAAGSGPLSSSLTFKFDPIGHNPSLQITEIIDDVPLVTGQIPNHGITNDNSPLVKGTYGVTLNPGDHFVLVRDDSTVLAVPDANVNTAAKTWSYQDGGLADGEHSYVVRIVDVGGAIVNVSDRWAITVDATPPTGTVTIASYVDDAPPVTGTFLSGTTTDDNTPLLQGTVSGLVEGDIVRIYNQSGTTLTLIGDAQVSGGNWTYQVTDQLPDGEYHFIARLEDTAGNIGPTSPAPLNVKVDTVTVTTTVAITGITDDVTPVTGNVANPGTTNDSTPELHGTVSAALTAGQHVEIYRNNLLVGTATMASGGTSWSFTDSTGGMANNQTYKYTAKVVSDTGAAGTPSTEYEMTLNLGGQVKFNPIAGNNVLDPTEAAGNVTISGTLENMPSSTTASSVQVVVNVGGTNYNATVAGTTWNVTVAGSALNAATTSGHGSVGATLTFEDNTHTAATVTASQGYMLHVDPSPVSLYSVGTARAGLGYSMSVLGDLNGDGYADYVVSAPGTHNGGLATAAAYVLYGGPGGLPKIGAGLTVGNLDLITAAQGFKISNSNGTGHFGTTNVPGGTVTDLGDFNGDGLSDIALVSPMTNTVTVIYGQLGTPWQNLDLSKLTPSQGFKVTAVTGFLYGVTGTDVNGDGYSDLIFSDPTAGPSISNGLGGGAAYVVYGHAGTQSNISTVANSSSGGNGNSITLQGAGAMGTGYTVLTSNGYTGLGTVVKGVGDVNGDGYADYVVTAPDGMNWGNNKPGWAYLVFGGPSGITKGSIVNMTALDNMASLGQGYKINASNPYEFLGGKRTGGVAGLNGDGIYAQYHSVDSLGNIDGSGKNAFAIGSPGAINPYTCADLGYPGTLADGAGAVYVMYGNSAAALANVTLPTYSGGMWTNLGSLTSTGGFVIFSKSFADKANGTRANSSDLGFSVGSAGDVNGDGIGDFLIGAPQANNGKGAVFLVFGTANMSDLWMTVGGTPQIGVVNLDQLVEKGKTEVFGASGTAVQYNGTQADPTQNGSGSYMGTDVTGGDYSGTGLSGYTFGAWGDNIWNPKTGQIYTYDGTTALLTQAINNADGAVYYAGSGVDRIATGSGNNVWVHGIGGADDIYTDTNKPHDAVSGGKGSDYIGIVGTNFTGINGGNGTDTVVFEGSNLKLDLTKLGLKVQGIEQFDLNNQTNTATTDPHGTATGLTTGNTLELRVSDVLSQMSDAPNSQRMTVLGDGSSTVLLDGGNWMSTGMTAIGGLNFTVYHNTSMGANTAADLLIQQGVLVTF